MTHEDWTYWPESRGWHWRCIRGREADMVFVRFVIETMAIIQVMGERETRFVFEHDDVLYCKAQPSDCPIIIN